MADTPRDDRPLAFEDLVAWFAKGEKPESTFRVGAEHEKFPFRQASLGTVAYDGPDGILALMQGLQAYGWAPVWEPRADGGQTMIGLERDGASVSLEPGGQFELSGAPLATMHEIAAETQSHLDEVHAVGERLGIAFAALGHAPVWRREDIPVMPKGRYKIMRAYMPKVGSLGLDMMFRTCTVQANLDFASEADMAAKFRVSLALQPVVTALFAASPFVDGRPSGFLTSRAHVWTDTDRDRTGLLQFVFEDGFGYETYARWALRTPMYFVKDQGLYVDVAGASFQDFMDGRLVALPGRRPTIKDWADHASTLFPEVRLKQYLEMRGADCGPKAHLDALPSLWAGLLYDPAAQAAAWDLCKHWTVEDRAGLAADTPRLALNAMVAGRRLRDVAVDMVAIAAEGLKRRNRLDAAGHDESVHLAAIAEVADGGVTLAERLLQDFHGVWGGRIDHVYEATRI